MNKLTALGIGLGLAGGTVYYTFWGCEGGCLITSNPYLTALWGAAMGGLLFSSLHDFLHRDKTAI